MSNYSGNSCLAGDIAIEIGDAFSEAMVVAFQACDDLSDPLSSLQKKQIVSSGISVLIDMRDKVNRIIELDGIARDCFDDPEKIKDMFNDIEISFMESEEE